MANDFGCFGIKNTSKLLNKLVLLDRIVTSQGEGRYLIRLKKKDHKNIASSTSVTLNACFRGKVVISYLIIEECTYF